MDLDYIHLIQEHGDQNGLLRVFRFKDYQNNISLRDVVICFIEFEHLDIIIGIITIIKYSVLCCYDIVAYMILFVDTICFANLDHNKKRQW